MKPKLSSFLSGLASFRRSFDEIATRIRHENDLALLKAQLFKPIQTYMEIASVQCAIEVELQDPKLREIYNSIELPNQSESSTTFPSANVSGMLDKIEKACQRDVGFAARLANARQELSVELREIRGKLQGDRKLHEAFRRIFNAHDALDSLRILGSLGNPKVPPSHTLIYETDQLAALLRANPGFVASSQWGDRQLKGAAGNSRVPHIEAPPMTNDLRKQDYTAEERAEARAAVAANLIAAAKEAELLPEGAALVHVRESFRTLVDAGCIVGELPELLPPRSVPQLHGEDLWLVRKGLEHRVLDAYFKAGAISHYAWDMVNDLKTNLYRCHAMTPGYEYEGDGYRQRPIHLHGPFAGLPLDEPDSVHCAKSLRSIDND